MNRDKPIWSAGVNVKRLSRIVIDHAWMFMFGFRLTKLGQLPMPVKWEGCLFTNTRWKHHQTANSFPPEKKVVCV